MSKTEQVSWTVPSDIVEVIEKTADSNRIKKSRIATQLLRAALKQGVDIYDYGVYVCHIELKPKKRGGCPS